MGLSQGACTPCLQDDAAEIASLPELVSDSESEEDDEDCLLDSLGNLQTNFRGACSLTVSQHRIHCIWRVRSWVLLRGNEQGSPE